MAVYASEIIKAPKERVWEIITDIENCDKSISSILTVKILEKPETGIVGLKWEETRMMFGKKATETMWISDAQVNQWYETTALNSGCEYKTRVQIDETKEGILLSMNFAARPLNLIAKLFTPLGWLFSGALKKALEKDLADIKTNLER